MTRPGIPGAGNDPNLSALDLSNLPPDRVNDLHRYDDVDASPEAHHHSLGPDINQASPGSHTHNGRDSRLLDFSGFAPDEHTHDELYVNEADHTQLLHTDLGLIANTAFDPVAAQVNDTETLLWLGI